MNIRITPQQQNVLCEVIDHFHWETGIIFEIMPTCVLIKSISDDDAIDLRELCSDYLLEVGFDDEYVANEKGRLLEELIDKLFIS